MEKAFMRKTQQEQEDNLKQEAIKKMAENVFSWIRETVGKKEKGWKEGLLEKELITAYNKTTSNSKDKAIFDELEILAKTKEEKEYINFLRKIVIQQIDDTAGDATGKGIKTHYGYTGAEILDALIPKYKGREVDWKKIYLITNSDFLRYLTEKIKKPIRIEDLEDYVNGGITDDIKEMTIKNYLKNFGIEKDDVIEFIIEIRGKQKEKDIKNMEQKKEERWLWARTAMKGMSPKTIEITFDEMEKNLLKHPELNGKLYYKALEIAINKIKAKENTEENAIRKEVNRAIIEAA